MAKFFKFLIFTIPVLLLTAQDNTTQVSLSDAQRAKYWRAQYELLTAEYAAERARSKWLVVIEATCPAGQSISTATADGEPSCIEAAPPK